MLDSDKYALFRLSRNVKWTWNWKAADSRQRSTSAEENAIGLDLGMHFNIYKLFLWTRFRDLLPSIQSKSSGIDHIGSLVEGELFLEEFLENESGELNESLV